MSTKRLPGQSLSRRRFFKMAGGATVAAAGMGVLPNPFKKLLSPVGISEAQAQTTFRTRTCSMAAPTAGSACRSRRRSSPSRWAW